MVAKHLAENVLRLGIALVSGEVKPFYSIGVVRPDKQDAEIALRVGVALIRSKAKPFDCQAVSLFSVLAVPITVHQTQSELCDGVSLVCESVKKLQGSRVIAFGVCGDGIVKQSQLALHP
jgi:hypothetical protein